MRINSNQGFTIMEGMVALAFVALLLFFSVSAIQQVKTISSSVSTGVASEKQILEIVENARSNFVSFKTNYKFYTESQAEAFLTDDKLSMAWDKNIIAPVGQCESCRGRYGFVIQPYEKFRGLYIMTLRMTHKDWPQEKRFRFLVSAK